MSVLSVGGSKKAQECLDHETPAKNDDRKGKRKLKFETTPLQGKKFYLDLPNVSSKKLQTLREDLELLGAEVSDFLSKDITHLVTNRKDAYQNENAASNISMSTPSPFQQKSSASHPHSPWLQSPQETDSPNSCDVKKPLPPSYNTRGKCFVQKAVATSHQYQGSSNLIATARKFNVKIKALDKVIDWIEQHKPEKQSTPVPPTANVKGKHRSITPSTPKVRCLKSPFIKVEDHSRMYKPQWSHFDHWPVVNYDSHPGMCPFGMDSKSGGKIQHRDTTMADRQHIKPHRKRKGYCECCLQQYDDFEVHLKSKQHTEFATNPENYKDVDESINRGVTFEEFLAKMWDSESEMQETCQKPNYEEGLDSMSDHQESQDDVKLIGVMTESDDATKSSWDNAVNDFIQNQCTSQSCDKPNVIENQDLYAQIEVIAEEHVNQGSQPEVETLQEKPCDPVSSHYNESSDNKTTGSFQGFSESDINQAINQVMKSLNLPFSSKPKKTDKHQKMPSQKSRQRHQKEDLDHPQEKLLNQGLTSQEKELTMSTLITGEKNLRSRTASLLANKRADSPSRKPISRKRKRQVISDEQTGSSVDFQYSPTWRQPVRRKQPKRKAKFIV